MFLYTVSIVFKNYNYYNQQNRFEEIPVILPQNKLQIMFKNLVSLLTMAQCNTRPFLCEDPYIYIWAKDKNADIDMNQTLNSLSAINKMPPQSWNSQGLGVFSHLK